jgi:hypothetical protein
MELIGMVDWKENVDWNGLTEGNNLRIYTEVGFGSIIIDYLNKEYAQRIKEIGVSRFYLRNNTDEIYFELDNGFKKDEVNQELTKMIGSYKTVGMRAVIELDKKMSVKGPGFLEYC